MTHRLTLKSREAVTRDTLRLTSERPQGLSWTPGPGHEPRARRLAGLTRLFTITDERPPGLMSERVDGAFLDKHPEGFDRTFCVSGPHPFRSEMIAILEERGVNRGEIVTDE